MAEFPRSAKLRKVFAAFGPSQRRQFWQATGIDIKKQAVNEEKLGALKSSLADYRRLLAKSSDGSGGEPVGPDCVCDACGGKDKSETYVSVPKCGQFCGACIDELIRDADSIA